MEEPNKTIINQIKTQKIYLLIILIIEIVGPSGIYYFTTFIEDPNFTKLFLVSILILIGVAILTTVIYFILIIYRLKTMIYCQPIQCIIEDFVYFTHRHDGKIEYKVWPIVKNLEDNKLYFTFGYYCLVGHNTVFAQNGSTLIYKRIYRKDKSIVKIGDPAIMYIRKRINPNIKIFESRNRLKISYKKTRFHHDNENYNINIFNELNYFEGFIDIENNN